MVGWLPAPAAAMAGVVTRVSDGDTVWVRPADGRKPVKLRLLGIDAPELCQAGGQEARAALSTWVLRRTVQVEAGARDDYGRLLGRLLLDGDDVGARLVRDGLAWSYRWRGRAGPYDDEEREARAAGRGVFGDPRALSPREFRRVHGPCRP